MGVDFVMTQYIQSNHYEATMLDDEWIILNTDHFTVTKLNGVGGYCWSLLSEAKTIDDIMKAVREHFAEVSEVVELDIKEFLADLIRCGLVSHVA